MKTLTGEELRRIYIDMMKREFESLSPCMKKLYGMFGSRSHLVSYRYLSNCDQVYMDKLAEAATEYFNTAPETKY
jgi:hypothetical protein